MAEERFSPGGGLYPGGDFASRAASAARTYPNVKWL